MAELQTVTVSGLPNAATPLTGSERVLLDQATGSVLAASALVAGKAYRIEVIGNTNWLACGVPSSVTPVVGLTFQATAPGSGTGTAIEVRTVDAPVQAIVDLADAGAGTVTSVALSAPAGFSVSGSPVTTAGTLVLSFSPGYSLPADSRQEDWDAAFTQRRTWDGGSQHLNAANGRASLQLGSAAQAAATDFATAAQGSKADTAIQPGTLTTALAGKADLVGGLVPSSQLPGFVDDVLEFANLAAFPATGETGKIYVSLATGRIYRWSGSVYIELVGSPGSTDAVPEGSVNLYFTTLRGQTAASSWWASYASSVGQALVTAGDSAAARSAISAEQAGAAATAQAAAVQRSNHTGSQLANTISDFASAVTALGTTVGNALRSLVNPSAVSFLRINADNSVTARSASEMRTDLGLGSAAQGTIGTAAGNVVALDPVTARLPAVDASQLTNLPAGGTPGGSTTQIQYNNAGAFAGLSTFTTDGTNVTLSGRLTNSTNGAASAPPLSLTGTWFSGGTGTTTKPQFLIEPAGTTSTNWSTAGTGLGVNAPSVFTGNLLDLQAGAKSVLKMGVDPGSILFRITNSANPQHLSFDGNSFRLGRDTATSPSVTLSASSDYFFKLAFPVTFGWTATNSDAVFDLCLLRDAAGILAQRNGINAQAFRVYNTFTSSTNYELGKLEWASNVFRIGTEKGSGGGTARAFELQTDGTTRIQISRDGVWRNTQPAPAAVNTTATLTIANLQTGIITTTTAAAVDMTLPTGTDVEGGFAVNSNDLAFSWSIINTGGNAATILAATGHTIVGSPAVAANTSGRFTTRRTAANTYVTYRLS